MADTYMTEEPKRLHTARSWDGLRYSAELYRFNGNRRRYALDKNGIPFGSPIWTEHWEKYVIVGDNRLSWLACPVGCVAAALRPGQTDRQRRWWCVIIPKREKPRDWLLSAEEIELAGWVHAHKHRVADEVHRLDVSEHAKLRKIAELLGYEG